MKNIMSVLMLTSLFAAAVQADEPLVSKLEALIVTTGQDGAEVLTPADTAAPGAVIEYRLSYENVSKHDLSGLIVSGPVPEGAQYLPGTSAAESKHEFQVSIDGGESWHPEPLMRTVVDADGAERTEVVPAEEYTGIRWVARQPLVAQSTQAFSYRVQIRSADAS